VEESDLVLKLEAALYAAGDRPGTGKLARTGTWVQLTTPDARTHHRNAILRSIVDPEGLEARVDAAVDHYRGLGVPFCWFVTPSTRPLDTADVLLRKGFEHLETLHAMVADPAAFPPPPSEDITVEAVGEDGIATWVECAGRGWNMPPDGVERLRGDVRRALQQPDRSRFYFLARCRGAPAGTSSIKLLDGFAHFNGAAVPEAFRRRGIYRALVLERMRFVRERGLGLVTNHAVSTTAAPICARLGFRLVCTFDVYAFRPDREERAPAAPPSCAGRWPYLAAGTTRTTLAASGARCLETAARIASTFTCASRCRYASRSPQIIALAIRCSSMLARAIALVTCGGSGIRSRSSSAADIRASAARSRASPSAPHDSGSPSSATSSMTLAFNASRSASGPACTPTRKTPSTSFR
jgi:GNAT superfamily N-acetyltransferase